MTDQARPTLPTLDERRTTSDHLAESLRDAILSGLFEDGEELNQVALAKHYGVSRVPVREALRQLQAEGLVVAKAHHRTVVSSLTPERVVEVIQLRALIEAYLLEHSAPNLDEKQLDELEELCDAMDATTDHSEWLALNRRFHELLYEPSGATVGIQLSHQLSARVSRYLHMHHTGVERNREANMEHRRVLACLREEDLDGAVGELREHVTHTGNRVAALFKETSSSS